MKKILKYAAALAVILPVACNKDMNPSEGLAPEGKTVKVTVNATTNQDPVSKVVLDGNQFKWVEGDSLKLRWANNILGDYYAMTESEVVYAVGNGSNVAFEGEIRYAEESVYTYYSNSGYFYSLSSIMYCHDISDNQTGRKEDLKDNVVYYARIHKNNIIFNKVVNSETSVEEVTSVDFDAAMSPAFALLKLNVPEELALTKITIDAKSNIYGRTYISPHKSWGTFGEGSNSHFHRPPVGDETPQGKTITISRGGEVISGDIYVALAIDGFDSTKENYYNTTDSLTFTLTNMAGEFEYTKNLKEPIYLGSIKDLGSIPATVMPVGTLGLIGGDKSTVTVGIMAPNPGYKFYYEVGTSAETCQTPTALSSEFDIKNGLSFSNLMSHDKYYIKVFADTELSNLEDCYMEGYLRSWRFLKDCPTAGVLSTWTEESSPVTTSDGLYISNTKSGSISYNQYDDFMKLSTPFVSINVLPEHASKFWMNFYVGSSSRGYNLNVGNATSGKSEYNGNTTKHSVTGSTNNCFTWYLGEVTSGLNLALRGDGQHNYYRMSVLEVL